MKEEKKRDMPQVHGMDDISIPFADYVQVTTSPETGAILTFAQTSPQAKAHHGVARVFLPLSVAGKLVAILLDHLSKAEKDTNQKFLPENLQLEIQEKQISSQGKQN